MIKSENGIVKLEGKKKVLFADFVCVAVAISEELELPYDEMPLIFSRADKTNKFLDGATIDYMPADQCENKEAWYTCFKCGKCGRRFEDGYLADDGGTTVTEEEEKDNE